MNHLKDNLLHKPSIELLRQVQQAGFIDSSNGEKIPFEDQMDEVSYAAIYEVLRLIRPDHVLELGFAHACSTLFMLQALFDNEKGDLISVDPLQLLQYKSGGLRLVEKSGFGNLHQHLNGPSEIVLPQLLLKSYKFQFILIDTTHQFDQTILEFFYCDKLLPPGGVVALHDYELLSVRAACNFIEANLNYKLHASHQDNLRMLQKTANDHRNWYEFVPFEVPKGNQAVTFETPTLHKKDG